MITLDLFVTVAREDVKTAREKKQRAVAARGGHMVQHVESSEDGEIPRYFGRITRKQHT